MSWTPLAPVLKSSGSAQITARIAQMKSGTRTLIVFVSEMLHTELGGLERVDVAAGDGENAGQLLIHFHADGAFLLKNGPRGSKQFRAPTFEGLPEFVCASLACRVISKGVAANGDFPDGGFEVIVELPVHDWNFNRPTGAKALPAPANGTAVQRTLPAPAPVPDGVLDLVTYLTKKGHTVVKRGVASLQIDGEVYTRDRALMMVNAIRQRDGLPALGLDQVA